MGISFSISTHSRFSDVSPFHSYSRSLQWLLIVIVSIVFLCSFHKLQKEEIRTREPSHNDTGRSKAKKWILGDLVHFGRSEAKKWILAESLSCLFSTRLQKCEGLFHIF